MSDTKEWRLYFRRALEAKMNEAWLSFLEAKGVSERFVYLDKERLVSEEVDLGIDDLVKELSERKHPTEEDVITFVDESYDYHYFVLLFEREVDIERIEEDLQEELLLRLRNTEPYGNFSDRYWISKIREVPSISLLGRYAENDLEEFVLDFAPDWQYELQEECE